MPTDGAAAVPQVPADSREGHAPSAADHRRVGSERRIVSTLFADVVDSTAIAEKLDPEDVTELMNGAFRILTEPINRHGGTVARLMGDAILCLFGAPVTHEDDAVRACRAALDILAGTGAYDSEVRFRYGINFQVRVGISTGLAVVGQVGTDKWAEYTAMGDAVNLAARLQSNALPATAFIDDRTRELTSQVFITEDKGLFNFKGRSEPVHVFQLVRRRPVPTARRAADATSPLVNRQMELAQLSTALDGCGGSESAVWSIVGDAGIGKSRLLAETRQRADSSITWIEGRCLSHTQDISYWVVQEILQELMDIDQFGLASHAAHAFRRSLSRVATAGSADPNDTDPSDRDRRQLEFSAPLAHLLDVPLDEQGKEYLSSLSADRLKQCIQQSFTEYMRFRAQEAPLVLVWEDVHWIDPQSLELLAGLCRSVQEMPLLLFLVTRPPSGHDADCLPLLKLRCGKSYREIRLGPLSNADCIQLLQHLVDVESVPRQLQDRILTIAEGNPLCIEQMLQSVVDAGVSGGDGGDSGKGPAIPVTVEAAILARVDRLSARDKRVLQTASVIGRAFHPDVLHRVLEPRIPIAELSESFASLQSQGFIFKTTGREAAEPDTGGMEFRSAVRLAHRLELAATLTADASGAKSRQQYVFTHALVAEAVYQSLLKSVRRELHQRTGTIIEALFPDRLGKLAPTLAYHFEKGEMNDKALAYLLKTASQAMVVFALARTVDCYRRALKITERQGEDQRDPALVIRILVGLGDVHFLRSEYQDALTMYQRALAVADDPGQRASLSCREGELFGKWGKWDKAQASFEAGLETMKTDLDEQTAARIYSGLSLVHCHAGDLEAAAELGELALAMSQKNTGPRGEAQARSNLGIVTAKRGHAKSAREHYEASLTIFETIGDRYGLAACHNNLGCLAKEASRWDEAVAHLKKSLELFENLGNEHAAARVLGNLGDVYYATDQIELAQEHVARAVELLTSIGVDDSGPLPEMWQSGIW